jgi:hypothetical protein
MTTDLRDPLAEVQVTFKIAELAIIVSVFKIMKAHVGPPTSEADLGFQSRMDDIVDRLIKKISEGP